MNHEKHENKSRGLVPGLRFPEFRDAGEWKERPISDLLIKVNRPMDMVDTEDHSLVTVKRRYGGIVTRGIFKGASIKVKSQFYIQENDFLISKRQIVHNACGVVPKEFAGSIVSNEYSVLKATQVCDIAFFNYFSQQPIVSRSFLKCSIGIHIEKMLFRLNDWLKQEFLFPVIKEQQKIADCLSSLNELITAEAQKHDTLKAHKKGLMQKLFPAEGENVPELRFPEFRDAGEWEERELGKEATIVMGASPKSEFYNEENIGLPLLQGNTDIKNRVSAPRIFTSQVTKECQKGNILLSVRAPVGTVAKSLHHACIGRGIAAIRANKDNSQEFLYQWLFAFEPQWQNISQGGTFDAVKSDDLRQLIIAFPKIPEQQKIADCLSSLDELITAEAQKIDTLKAHKKGLMQGLFPSADEVGV